jgi:hypothetical protein
MGIPRVALEHVERVISAIRPECLDHVMVFKEADLCRHMKLLVSYDHESRTHLWLAQDTLESRPAHSPEPGRVVAIPNFAVFTTGTSGAQPEFRRAPSRPLAGTSAPRLGPA